MKKICIIDFYKKKKEKHFQIITEILEMSFNIRDTRISSMTD